MPVDEVIRTLDQMVEDLWPFRGQETNDINEVKRMRAELLKVVREFLHPQIGHMPAKRYY